MSYQRVTPRDLFNEGNLLKCLGRVYINLEGLGRESTLEHDGEAFDIHQDEDGGLYVSNVVLRINEFVGVFSRPLNSRRAWPLYLTVEDGEREIQVFEESGEFTADMLAFLGN